MGELNLMKIGTGEYMAGGDMQVLCSLENGKVLLEWQFNREEAAHICLKDIQGNVVLECYKMWDEEEPLQSVLLKPCLWSGVDNPYLYHLEVTFKDRYGNFVDRLDGEFPLRSITAQVFCGSREKSLLLNGEKILWKTVCYHMPVEKAFGEQHRRILEDIRQLVDLGVNSICVKREEISLPFLQLCDRFGLLVVVAEGEKLWVSGQEVAEGSEAIEICDTRKIPLFRGAENALLTSGNYPTQLYYQYKARWAKIPFAYIWPDSLQRMKNGNYEVTCFSNCGKLALYSDGKLFEFQQGREIFKFQEIPAPGPCIVLAAEGEGCSASLSVHKNFTKLSPNGDN